MSVEGSVPARDRRFSFGSGTVATDVSLRMAESLSFEQWEEIGRRLVPFGDAARWWIGDWLSKGEWRYGERARAVAEVLGRKYAEVRDWAYVAEHVPEPVRRPPQELSFTHHRLVAKLVPAEQERWLARAVEEDWSKRELQEALVRELAPARESHAGVLEQLRITVDEERLARYQAAAERVGTGVNEWAVAVLDVEAAK